MLLAAAAVIVITAVVVIVVLIIVDLSVAMLKLRTKDEIEIHRFLGCRKRTDNGVKTIPNIITYAYPHTQRNAGTVTLKIRISLP
jgi:hypothetical protein